MELRSWRCEWTCVKWNTSSLSPRSATSRAAELTGISQSGLSSAIRSLEEELGTPLFDRTTRRVELTEAGLVLLPHARQMIAQAVAARDAVVTASREVTGSLRVGSEQCLGFVDVVGLLERFHRRHPRVETHFTQAGSQDLIALARSGNIDVAFVASTKHLGALPHRTLGEESLVLLTAPNHPLAASSGPRPEVTWRQLEGADFIDFTPSWGVRDINDETLAAHGVSRRVRCTVNDVHAPRPRRARTRRRHRSAARLGQASSGRAPRIHPARDCRAVVDRLGRLDRACSRRRPRGAPARAARGRQRGDRDARPRRLIMSSS
jgi:DNA-binding transcriptional LysR family regulator